jgi:YidC/Oxa1 family membrane protein insertase
LDQRRFISFLLLAVGVFLLSGRLFPLPEQPKKPPEQAAQEKGKDQPKDAAPAADAKKADEQAAIQPAPPAPPAEPGGVPVIAPATALTEYVALGSLDPNSGYRMLVTLTNAGAAVVRAEMASPRYRDQHDWAGYLGSLELKNVRGGVLVQVVGAGTPAANAKLERGDIIVGIGDPVSTEIKNLRDFAAAFAATRPSQEITLQVRHGDKAPEPRKVRLMRRPFAVVRPEMENFQMREVMPPQGFVEKPSLLLTLSELNGKPLGEADAKLLAGVLETGNWELAAHDEKSATFRRALPELKLEIIKRYTLAVVPADQLKETTYPAYHLQLDVELNNTEAADPNVPAKQVAYRLDGPTGMPLEGWWYATKVSRNWSGGSLRNVIRRYFGGSATEIANVDVVKGKESLTEGQALAYAGVDGQYFSAILIPQLSAIDDSWFSTVEAIVAGEKPDIRDAVYANITCRLTRKPLSVNAGATHRDSYQIFLGPKRPDLLGQYYPKSEKWPGDSNYSLRDLVYFGWFGSIARLMLGILHFLYSIVGNYGIAIILLTVLVRGAMFPISYKQTQNMARMQALKPEMDAISEKYKNDMQKKSQAIQELYRKHNINPLGGCLPLLLQMPIFIGLYRALLVDVELRQSPLFGPSVRWCSNLAAPDMFLDWTSVMPSFITHGILGPYLNVLPIITVAIMLVTQKMSMPPPTNEQAAMQQKMMKYMMIFMGVLFYKVASGLCLYLIVSSLWGIAERKLLPKAPTPDGDAPGAATTSFDSRKPRGGPNGAGPKRPRRVKRKK